MPFTKAGWSWSLVKQPIRTNMKNETGIDRDVYKHLDIRRGTSMRDRELFDSVDGGSPRDT
ncbi:MAG: hypothetical protein QXV95_02760 [Sulfolobales archaeon]